MTYSLNMSRLATLVRTKRGSKGLREAAREIGNVSPSTLSRVENGKMPDMETFLLLCGWLQVHPSQLIEKSGESRELNNSEAIALAIRSDSSLDPTVAKVLATFVETAYRLD